MNEPFSLSEQLATHLQRPVDDITRRRARLHLLDWLACVAGALKSDVAKSLKKADVRDAAWLGNVLDMDDVYRAASLNPGPAIWPASLDTAYEVDASMDDMLDAAARGYDAMITVGATFDPHHNAHFHTTATAGVFGSAVAAGFLYELTQEELVWAMGNAGSTTGGLRQMRDDIVMTKQWQLGQVRGDGSFAALMAKAGVSGSRHILEGPEGLYAATCREPKPMQFRDHWHIHDVSFKPWAAVKSAKGNVEVINAPGDPERPLSEEGLFAKVHSLFRWGGLNWAAANKAITYCLEGDDPDALYEMLDDWLT